MRAPIGNRIIRLETVDSTNSFVLQNPESLENHGTVVIAENQTSGRGRNGRQFLSFPGKNLTFSVVIHSTLAREDMGFYSLLAGIAVVRALQSYTSISPRLKWPNDVLVDHRKICGILIEQAPPLSPETPVLVMGIGINCLGTPGDYPNFLKNQVTTLQALQTSNPEMVHPIDPEMVFQEVLKHLEQVLQELLQKGKSALVETWLKHSNAMGAQVRYETKNGFVDGTIEGMTQEGYLLIRHESGRLDTHISGDVLYQDSPYGG